MGIILNSFLWGLFILEDTHFYNDFLSALFIVGLIASIVGMILCFPRPKVSDENIVTDDSQTSMIATFPTVRQPQKGNAKKSSLVLGVAAALFNGIWGGANLIPSEYAPYHGIHYALSYSFGATIANVTLLLGYAALRKLSGVAPLPPFHFRVMATPGFLSGCLWSAGNFCSLYAVSVLGEGIGYSLIQSSVIISGAWGIIWYRELSGYRILVWSFFLIACVGYMIGLATQKSPT